MQLSWLLHSVRASGQTTPECFSWPAVGEKSLIWTVSRPKAWTHSFLARSPYFRNAEPTSAESLLLRSSSKATAISVLFRWRHKCRAVAESWGCLRPRVRMFAGVRFGWLRAYHHASGSLPTSIWCAGQPTRSCSPALFATECRAPWFRLEVLLVDWHDILGGVARLGESDLNLHLHYII